MQPKLPASDNGAESQLFTLHGLEGTSHWRPRVEQLFRHPRGEKYTARQWLAVLRRPHCTAPLPMPKSRPKRSLLHLAFALAQPAAWPPEHQSEKEPQRLTMRGCGALLCQQLIRLPVCCKIWTCLPLHCAVPCATHCAGKVPN